ASFSRKAATVPKLGQLIFALSAGFIVAGMVVQRVFNVPISILLFGPPVVAICAYLYAGSDSVLTPLAEYPPAFILSSARIATILPIQFIGVGSLSVMTGYWLGIRARHIHFHSSRLVKEKKN
ncbi:MAG: hypothetical protein JW860_14775, partial [Sedimentisphaerales bacterium]|nr:hypothetical protein [Sedimentisphaerales bacterium]